jgi:MFS family permease
LTLYALFVFAALNHALKTGSNVTLLLGALSLDASPVVVGAVTSIGSLLPTLLAVSIGRLNDRFGPRLPLFAGSVIVILSSLLPVLWPGLPALFATAILTGLGSTAFGVSIQSVVGWFGQPDDRPRNFSWLSIAFSSGAILGPMLAGSVIDLAGFASAFVVLAFLALPALVTCGAGRLVLPQPRAARGGAGSAAGAKGARRALDLLRDRQLRTVYLLTALHVSAWEVFSFLVPVYGSGIGLAATSIGFILGTFSAATFFVRLVMPYFARRFAALGLIRASLVLAGILFVFFPLTSSVPLLAALAFILGMGLGIPQPLAMAVLHESAPSGRTGEAVGLRTAVVNFSAMTTPLAYGALGSAFGMTPVFWGIAAAVWLAVWALG